MKSFQQIVSRFSSFCSLRCYKAIDFLMLLGFSFFFFIEHNKKHKKSIYICNWRKIKCQHKIEGQHKPTLCWDFTCQTNKVNVTYFCVQHKSNIFIHMCVCKFPLKHLIWLYLWTNWCLFLFILRTFLKTLFLKTLDT